MCLAQCVLNERDHSSLLYLLRRGDGRLRGFPGCMLRENGTVSAFCFRLPRLSCTCLFEFVPLGSFVSLRQANSLLASSSKHTSCTPLTGLAGGLVVLWACPGWATPARSYWCPDAVPSHRPGTPRPRTTYRMHGRTTMDFLACNITEFPWRWRLAACQLWGISRAYRDGCTVRPMSPFRTSAFLACAVMLISSVQLTLQWLIIFT